MSGLSEQAEAAADLVVRLGPFGPVSVRRMFGAYGVFYQGLMIALLNRDTLYLKSDQASVSLYHKQGCEQFTYQRQGRSVGLSYFAAPNNMFDSPDSVMRWCTVAYESALRAQAAKPKRKHKRARPKFPVR